VEFERQTQDMGGHRVAEAAPSDGGRTRSSSRFARRVPPVLPEGRRDAPDTPEIELPGRTAHIPVTVITRVSPRRTPMRFVARVLLAPWYIAVAFASIGLDTLFVMSLLGISL